MTGVFLQVVYVAVTEDAGVMEFQRRLSDRLLAAGVTIADSRRFVPHCTIVKLSGRLVGDVHSIDPSLYAAFKSLTFGEQAVRGIHLCTINAPKQADGFYSRVCSVENGAAGAGAVAGSSVDSTPDAAQWFVTQVWTTTVTVTVSALCEYLRACACVCAARGRAYGTRWLLSLW